MRVVVEVTPNATPGTWQLPGFHVTAVAEYPGENVFWQNPGLLVWAHEPDRLRGLRCGCAGACGRCQWTDRFGFGDRVAARLIWAHRPRRTDPVGTGDKRHGQHRARGTCRHGLRGRRPRGWRRRVLRGASCAHPMRSGRWCISRMRDQVGGCKDHEEDAGDAHGQRDLKALEWRRVRFVGGIAQA